MVDINKIFDNIKIVGPIIGVLGLIFKVNSSRARRPCIKFDQGHFSGIDYKDGQNGKQATMSFSGVLSNLSQDPNTIDKIYLIVWDRKCYSAKRYGYGGEIVGVELPLRMDAKESKKVDITFTIQITGTVDERLMPDDRPRGRVFHGRFAHFIFTCKDRLHFIGRERYNSYSLAFYEVHDLLFTSDGKLCNQDEISRRWLLTNYQGVRRKLKWFGICYSRIKFYIRVVLLYLGVK